MCDSSLAITAPLLRKYYEAKIQMLSMFSWKPAQPRYVTRKLLFQGSVKETSPNLEFIGLMMLKLKPSRYGKTTKQIL